MHALIIEDESIIAMEIEEILRDNGFTSIDVAPSPATAIAAAVQRRPDLITSDVQLKPGCGIATVSAICENSAVPVVFITGNMSEVVRKLSAYRIISKPFSAARLSAAVAAALGSAGVRHV